MVKVHAKNGETNAQMEHAFERSKTQDDTSKDVEWEVDSSLAITDKYCTITTYAYLLIKILVFVVPLLVCGFPISLAVWIYGFCLRTPTERVERTCGFYMFCLVLLPFALPFIVIAFIAYIFDSIFYSIFSVTWYLVRCCIEDGTDLRSSYLCISPYRNGPSLLCHLSDIVVGLIGQGLRQGLFETTGKLTFMIMVVPWMKYYINANPWLYQLDERFITQITTSMKDLEIKEIQDAFCQIISRCKQVDDLRDDQDIREFASHYPYPPPGRNYAIGIQAVGTNATGMFFFLHVTHTVRMHKHEKDPDFFIRSNTTEMPTIRAMCWYNNPYCMSTGWVEVAITTGGKYQPDKIRGLEHPMWLLTSHSPMLSGRKSNFVGQIDSNFDAWLPIFVFEIRQLVKGTDYARSKFELVISEDGISRPAGISEAPDEL